MNETMVSHAALNRAKFAIKSYTVAVSRHPILFYSIPFHSIICDCRN